MANIAEDAVLEEHEINKIKTDKKLPAREQKKKVEEVIRTFIAKRQPSHKTIFNVANTMVGSTTMVIPLNFAESGMITSIIVLFCVGLISFKTVDLLVLHFRKKENDVADAVFRILGKKWFHLFMACSVALLYVALIIYFILMSNVFYTMSTGFAELVMGYDHGFFPAKTDIEFGKFSYQWAGIILISIIFLTFLMRDSTAFVKLNGLGIYAVGTFLVFVIGVGVYNLMTKDIDFNFSFHMPPTAANGSTITLFTGNVIKLVGVFALAFFLHNIPYSIIKHNEVFENNSRDVGLGYLLTAFIYALVGAFGYLSTLCDPKDSSFCLIDPTSPNTIMDFFNAKHPLVIVVEFALVFQLFTVAPILAYCARTQFLNLVMKNPKPPGVPPHLVNIFMAISCLIPQMFNVDPSVVIAWDGALCGFFLIYLIPINLHLKMLYGDKNELRRSLAQPSSHVSLQTVEGIEGLADFDESALAEPLDGQPDEKEELDEEEISMFDKVAEKEKNFPKWLRMTGFSLLMLYGFAVLVMQVIQMI